MNIMDKAIDYVAPIWSLKRTIARQRHKRLNNLYSKSKGKTNRGTFDAIDDNRLQYDFLNDHNDADTALFENLEDLRNFTRRLEYNNGYVAGPLRRLSDHIVGTGFKFQSRASADKKYSRVSDGARITQNDAEYFNYQAERLFSIWANKQCDVHLSQTLSDMHYLSNLARNRDGEVLVVGRNSPRPDRLIPYCQQIVEIDRLETPTQFISDEYVSKGIRYDAEGVPVSYYIRNRHPGDNIHNYKTGDNDFEEIPAFNPNGTRKVFHLFRRMRPEQTRGFSAIASGLPSIQNALRYANAEMFAALEDACMTAIVKSNAPTAFQENYSEAGDEADKRIHEFSPGKWHYLNPQEDITIRDPSRPNDKFTEILHSFYEGPSNSLNMPPEIFLQNWNGMNYSNARTVIIMWLKTLRIEQQFDVDHYLSETWANVLPQLIAKGLIKANAYSSRKWDYLSSQWIPPKMDWIDPLKEVQGKKEEIAIYSETPQSVCATKGVDFDENAESMAIALKKIKELEKQYGIKMPSITGEKSKKDSNLDMDDNGEKKSQGKILKIRN